MGDEEPIRALWTAGDLDGAATRAIELYGPEILGFLCATLRDDDAGADAFSRACAALWKALPAYRWEASLRTWFYTLARNAAARGLRDRQRRHEVPLAPEIDVVARVRSRTMAHLRTEVKDRFAQVRAGMDPDDQALLILRVDRGLDWMDVARVMADAGADPAELSRLSARLRKRFQGLKEELRERARAAGLLDGDP